jgi:hypothetical protein
LPSVEATPPLCPRLSHLRVLRAPPTLRKVLCTHLSSCPHRLILLSSSRCPAFNLAETKPLTPLRPAMVHLGKHPVYQSSRHWDSQVREVFSTTASLTIARPHGSTTEKKFKQREEGTDPRLPSLPVWHGTPRLAYCNRSSLGPGIFV